MIQNLKKKLSNFLKNNISSSIENSLKEMRSFVTRPVIYMGNNIGLTRTIYGERMYVRTDDLSLAPHLMLDGYWENWITKVFRQELKPNMTVIDVGANIGYYTLMAANIVGPKGKVISFEANPETHDILFRNIHINGYLERVTTLNKAVYLKSTSLEFNVLEKYQGSCSIFNLDFVEKHFLDKVKKIQVEAISLDEYIPQGNRVDFIKIDAEGAEPYILLGAERILNQNKDIILMMEWAPHMLNHDDIKVSDLYQYLSNKGFSFFIIENDSSLNKANFEELIKITHADVLIRRC